MRKDKEKAFDLRREGKSYSEIHAALNIPRATLSGWFSEIDWSEMIKRQLIAKEREPQTSRLIELNRVREQNLKNAYEEARTEARREFFELKYNALFIAGVSLYWGEGDKRTKYSTSVSNTDAELIRLYAFFLRNACRVPEERIKAHLLTHPDLNEKKCREYWSKEVGIQLKHFSESTVIPGNHKSRRLQHGVCTVGVSSTYFKAKMLEWLTLLPKELMNKEYYEKIG